MPKRTVQIMVEEYLSLADRRGLLYDRSSCRDAQKEKELRKKAHTIFEAFLKDCDYKDDSIQRKSIGEDIWLSLRDIICTMKRKSGEEYLILNDFFAFLWDRCRVEIKHFDRQLTSLERQLSIAKDMHDFNQARTFDRHTVAEKYLVSDRTIDNDLAALREGISVMDQKLALKNFRLKNHKVTAVSTMHPLFLTQNLTQIICMLEGLRMMKDNWTMASYVETTAVNIWCQLSDYARDRITGTPVDMMGLDASWYKEISHRAESVKDKMFYDEKEAGDGFGLLMYALKGSLPCSVCYIDPDDTCREINGKVIQLEYDTDTIKIQPDSGGTPVWIEKDRILEVEVATELR